MLDGRASAQARGRRRDGRDVRGVDGWRGSWVCHDEAGGVLEEAMERMGGAAGGAMMLVGRRNVEGRAGWVEAGQGP